MFSHEAPRNSHHTHSLLIPRRVRTYARTLRHTLASMLRYADIPYPPPLGGI